MFLKLIIIILFEITEYLVNDYNPPNETETRRFVKEIVSCFYREVCFRFIGEYTLIKTKFTRVRYIKMLSKSKIVPSIAYRYFSSKSIFVENSYFDISEEVRNALDSKKPVVALESTIVTHGMPYPSNVECALEVENVVREQVGLQLC